jgi:hypothetical protein
MLEHHAVVCQRTTARDNRRRAVRADSRHTMPSDAGASITKAFLW